MKTTKDIFNKKFSQEFSIRDTKISIIGKTPIVRFWDELLYFRDELSCIGSGITTKKNLKQSFGYKNKASILTYIFCNPKFTPIHLLKI